MSQENNEKQLPALVVKKSTPVVRAQGKLSPNQLNIFTVLIKSIKEEATNLRYEKSKALGNAKPTSTELATLDIDPDMIPDVYTYDLTELSELMFKPKKSLSVMFTRNSEGEGAIEGMMSKVLTFPSDTDEGWIKEQLLGRSSYDNGILKLTVNPKVKEAILHETNGVSIVNLRLFMTLNSTYDKRLLDFISQFKNERDYVIGIEQLTRMLEIDLKDFGQGFKTFRVSVIERPLQRIFKASNGVWSPRDEAGKGFEVIKRGRTAEKIRFLVNYDEEAANQVLPNKREEAERKRLAAEAAASPEARVLKRQTAMLKVLESEILAINTLNPTEDDVAAVLEYRQLADSLGAKIASDIMIRLNKVLTAVSA
ncbi:replication initiation protein [Ferrimonas kyonanensis]|uniref:replication initiation protein n=1 Tax=Ferrimonas kyonanensis TaxID=364763 RepID=UPI0004807CEE|nr:replication initiation protein [Ferrimonas kyonanensis]